MPFLSTALKQEARDVALALTENGFAASPHELAGAMYVVVLFGRSRSYDLDCAYSIDAARRLAKRENNVEPVTRLDVAVHYYLSTGRQLTGLVSPPVGLLTDAQAQVLALARTYQH